jgi:hypothetical protein
VRQQHIHEIVDAMLLLKLDGRHGQVGAVEAGVAMDVLGRHQVPPHRPLTTGIDRNIGTAG